MPFFKTLSITLVVLICAIPSLVVIKIVQANDDTRLGFQWVKHSLVVIQKMEKITALTNDLDTIQQRKGTIPALRNNLKNEVSELNKLTLDNPIQQARLDSIYQLLKTPFNNYINIAALRQLIAVMQQTESNLLTFRNQQQVKNRKTQSSLLILMLASCFLLTGSLLYVIFHQLAKRKRAEDLMEDTEKNYRQLVHNIKDYAIILLDTEGRIMSWNDGAKKINGYEENEILGKHISIFYTNTDIDKNEPQKNLENVARNGRHESFGWRRRQDGTLFYADIIFSAVYDRQNNIKGFVKFTRDMTLQKKAEQDMESLLEKDKKLNQIKSKFVSLASHEFKTPLSVILSSVSLIQKYLPDADERVTKHIARIKSNVDSLKAMLNDFLSLEKLESGAIEVNLLQTDLTHLVQRVAEEVSDALSANNEIIFHVAGQQKLVITDAYMLRNILTNLISNAIKYSPANTQVEININYEDSEVVIEIRDHGIGIPETELSTLFTRFFRASNAKDISGTGLGLSIVHKYLELIGGTISVSSIENKGSSFSITLPQNGTEHDLK